MKKALIIYNSVGADVDLYLIDINEEDVSLLTACQNRYINGEDNEFLSSLLKLDLYLRKEIFSSDEEIKEWLADDLAFESLDKKQIGKWSDCIISKDKPLTEKVDYIFYTGWYL